MSSGNAEIGHRAPQFKAIVVVPDGRLSDYREKYAVFFFHPLDFTFVYPMEIIAFSDRAEELKKLNCRSFLVVQWLRISWINAPKKQGGLGPVNIPLISDSKGTIAQDYGILKADEGISFRPFLLLTIKITTSDLPVGDSVDETLRLVQAFQFIDTHGKVCPAGWKPGSNTIKSDVQKSKEYFSKWPWAILGPGCNRRP
uniref:Peroxiredoxin-1 n=1 Tax=Capra hircus TaxID=9925 RepID=A0A8C2ND03_CAPHI